MPRRWSPVVVLLAGLVGAAPALARDLVIGITQFPSNLHPNIDSMLTKSYVLGLTQRPFTAFDQDWQLVCLLCTELPTLENGKAVAETTPDGKQGVALTYTIQPTRPGATARRSRPGRAVHLGGRPASDQRRRQCGAVPARLEDRPDRRQDLRAARREAGLQLQRHQRFPRAAGASRAQGVRGGSGHLPQPDPVRYAADQPGPRLRPVPDRAGRARQPDRARAATRPGGASRRPSGGS